MSNGLRLAELLALRLCHDLSGLVNAMLGASEAAIDDPGIAGEALAIISEAAQQMTRRIRLVRAAWGEAAPLSVSEFSAMATGLGSKRITIVADDIDPKTAFHAEGARVALNALLLGVEALHGTGVLTIEGDPSGALIFRIDGPQVSWPAGFLGLLAEPERAWDRLEDPGSLQAPMTVLLAKATGLRLSVLLGANPKAAPPLVLNLGRPA